MALINCPECGNEISEYAYTCVHCGFPIREYFQGIMSENDTVYFEDDGMLLKHGEYHDGEFDEPEIPLEYVKK